MKTEDNPNLTVIIPCYNEVLHIHACLYSLEQEDIPASKLEMLVINGISEGTPELLESPQAKALESAILVGESSTRRTKMAEKGAGFVSDSWNWNTDSGRILAVFEQVAGLTTFSDTCA